MKEEGGKGSRWLHRHPNGWPPPWKAWPKSRSRPTARRCGCTGGWVPSFALVGWFVLTCDMISTSFSPFLPMLPARGTDTYPHPTARPPTHPMHTHSHVHIYTHTSTFSFDTHTHSISDVHVDYRKNLDWFRHWCSHLQQIQKGKTFSVLLIPG